ncbi:MAG: hypothetical protein ACO3A4_11550 [Silvanigrellaceae bacterium]
MDDIHYLNIASGGICLVLKSEKIIRNLIAMIIRKLNLSVFFLFALPVVKALPQSTKGAAPSLSGSNMTGGSVQVPPIVPNIRFVFDADRVDDCPFLVSASDGLIKDSNEGLVSCGELNSSWFADNIKLVKRTDTELVWKLRLNRAFERCVAKTSALTWNNKTVDRRKSYLILDFNKGTATLSLNLGGLKSHYQLSHFDNYLGNGVGWCLKLR